MLDKHALFNVTQCYVDGEVKQGRVLAIASYVDRQRVCFLIDKELIGIWLATSDIADDTSASNIRGGNKNRIDSRETSRLSIHKDESSPVKNISRVDRVSLITEPHKVLVSEVISTNNIDKALPKQVQIVLQYFNELVINFINPFSNQTFERYQKEVAQIKASKDNLSTEDIVNIITKNIIASNISGSTYEVIYSYLENFNISQDNSQNLLNDLISFNVLNTQSDYFDKNNLNVIWNNLQILLADKLQSALDLGKNIFDTTQYAILLVELIYKVGYAYGFDHRGNTPEFIAILGIALSSSMIKKMIVDGTTSNPIPTQLMLPLSSVVTLSIISYTARCYYQYPASISIEDIVSKLHFYIESSSFKNKVMELLPQQV
jgi:hypothetical protein